MYCLLLVEGWQSKAAFVVQFRERVDISAGRVEGKVEHIASHRAARFHSVEELLAFIAGVPDERKTRSASSGGRTPCESEQNESRP